MASMPSGVIARHPNVEIASMYTQTQDQRSRREGNLSYDTSHQLCRDLEKKQSLKCVKPEACL